MPLPTETYYTLIEVFVNNGRWKDVNETFQEALSMGIWRNHTTYEGAKFKIDLHGLTLVVAKELLKHYLIDSHSNIIGVGGDRIRGVIVITGRGNHVKVGDRRGLLQKEIVPFISETIGLRVEKIAGNDGRFLVHLPQKRSHLYSSK